MNLMFESPKVTVLNKKLSPGKSGLHIPTNWLCFTLLIYFEYSIVLCHLSISYGRHTDLSNRCDTLNLLLHSMEMPSLVLVVASVLFLQWQLKMSANVNMDSRKKSFIFKMELIHPLLVNHTYTV